MINENPPIAEDEAENADVSVNVNRRALDSEDVCPICQEGIV